MTDRGERPLVLTQGDPAGIGPELDPEGLAASGASMALPPFASLPTPLICGGCRADLGLDVPVAEAGARRRRDGLRPRAAGHPAHAAGRIAAPGDRDPSAALRNDRIDRDGRARWSATGAPPRVVTNPIAKHVLYERRLPRIPGHTEFLARSCRGAGERRPRIR